MSGSGLGSLVGLGRFYFSVLCYVFGSVVGFLSRAVHGSGPGRDLAHDGPGRSGNGQAGAVKLGLVLAEEFVHAWFDGFDHGLCMGLCFQSK